MKKDVFILVGFTLFVIISVFQVIRIDTLEEKLKAENKLNIYHHEVAVSMYVLGGLTKINLMKVKEYKELFNREYCEIILPDRIEEIKIRMLKRKAMNNLNEILNYSKCNTSSDIIKFMVEQNKKGGN